MVRTFGTANEIPTRDPNGINIVTDSAGRGKKKMQRGMRNYGNVSMADVSDFDNDGGGFQQMSQDDNNSSMRRMGDVSQFSSMNQSRRIDNTSPDPRESPNQFKRAIRLQKAESFIPENSPGKPNVFKPGTTPNTPTINTPLSNLFAQHGVKAKGFAQGLTRLYSR